MRILFEKLIKQKDSQEDAPLPLQQLLFPLTFTFSPVESSILQRHLADLQKIGIAIREFGNNTFVIEALASFYDIKHVSAVLEYLLHEIAGDHPANKQEHAIALVASRWAVPKKATISLIEAQMLVDQLLSCDNPYHCPKGKPTFFYLSHGDLLKLFQQKE